jgi:DNA-binding response OmpR family regulator
MEPKGKILIVDDEQINLDFFDVMLTKLGFQIEKAEDGEEALAAVKQTKPDLIILDNIMPKLTGWEVTKILKTDAEYEEVSSVPIIMFSAMDDVKDKIEGFELGIDDYITKPFNFSEVLARIQAVLRSRDLSHQVIQRERRLAVVESLNKSLLYFTEHLRNPVLELIQATENLDPSDESSVEEFKKLVRRESEQTLAALDGLQDEIKDLREQGDEIKAKEISLKDLEQKYQKRYESWKEKEASLGELKK